MERTGSGLIFLVFVCIMFFVSFKIVNSFSRNDRYI